MLVLHLCRILFILPAAGIVSSLLGRGQGCELHFQLHGLRDVLSLHEPEDQVIALLYTFFLLAVLFVQLCQFIGPSLRILMILIFAEYGDLIIKRSFLGPHQFIAEYIAGCIVWRILFKFIDQTFCFIIFAVPYVQIS